MILKREFLNNILAMQALDKIAASDKVKPGKVAKRIGKLHQKIKSEVNVTRLKWMELLKEYAIIDDKGEPTFENGNPKFDSKEKEKFHDAAFQMLMEEEIDKDVETIPTACIENCGLTPVEWAALDSIIL